MFPRVKQRTFVAFVAFVILSFGAFYLRNNLFGNSTENFVNAPGKLLLIDQDCLKRITVNLECDFPLHIAATSNFPKHLLNAANHLLRLEFLFDDEDNDQERNKDFWLFHPIQQQKANRNDGTRGRRAVRRFNTSTAYSASAHLLSFFPLLSTRLDVPSQIPAFLRAWQNGKFFDCGNDNGEPILKRVAASDSPPPNIPSNFSANIAAYSELIAGFNGTLFLFGGTLLGWRRECSFIPHTTDVDLGMLVEEHSEPLFRALLASDTFILGNILGHLKKGITLWTYVDGIKIDLFYVYTYRTRSKSFVAGFTGGPPPRILHWVYPQIREICAGELHGHLIHLPCNFDGVLQSDYGADWRIDHSSSKYIWNKSGKNIELGEILTAEDYGRISIWIDQKMRQKKNKTLFDAWMARIGVI